MQEHRLIERVLDALEIAAGHLERLHRVPPTFFLEAAEFIAGFADGCHHRKEEGVLFGAMIESGLPAGGGVIDMMLAEHEQGRALTRRLRDGARRLQAGDDTARAQVVSAARAYVALLRDHIAKEDEMLFPMADELFSSARHAQVLEEFGRVGLEEAGESACSEFYALAARLEQEARALSA
ncbi:MAG: hemerythrin domain-containing protein [Gemmatimonadales bacterium]